jgi:hypothetical protein
LLDPVKIAVISPAMEFVIHLDGLPPARWSATAGGDGEIADSIVSGGRKNHDQLIVENNLQTNWQQYQH